jgi:predicted dehydrogenase
MSSIDETMALTLSDAEKIVYTSLKHSKQVFCVMQNRYSPLLLFGSNNLLNPVN